MTEDNQQKNQTPYKMKGVAFPKAKYGVTLAIAIIFIVLFILYKDVLFKIF